MSEACPGARARATTVVAALLAAAYGSGGCAPSLATLQPAHVAPKGHVQVTAGMEIGIPTGTITKVVDAGRALSKTAQTQPGTITDDEKWQLFDAGVNLAASPPSVVPHFAIAYTFIDRAEIGVRYAAGGWRLGGRYQPLRHEDGPFDLVVGLGVARAATAFPLGDVLPVLTVDDFTRWTVDLPILVGTSRSWFRVWAGPKFLYSHFDTALRLDLAGSESVLASMTGHAFYYGGQAGLAVGYRYVFLGFELTLGELSGSVDSTAMLNVPTRKTDISGFVIYPAFALMGEF